MEIGSFRLSEIKEMFNVMCQYEMGASVYTIYVHRDQKMLVNITEGWYAYIHDYTVLYELEHINEFKHFKLRGRE